LPPATALPPRPPPAGSDAAGAGTTDPDGEPDLADYSWSAFWPWAKQLGYANKDAVEKIIDRPIAGLSPAELRDLVRAAHGDG